jgi:membrane fusion protein (multidrug efflux system)
MSVPDMPQGERGRAQRLRRPLMLGGIAVVVLLSLWVYFSGGRYASTDNAYVRAAQTSISADISARVVAVEVRENQAVHRGDVLFRLDDQPFRIAVEQARARLAAVTLEIEALKAAYRGRTSELASARQTRAFQESQYKRQKGLLESGISSETQVEQLRHDLDEAQSRIAASEQAVAGVVASLAGDPDLDPQQHPRVLQAKAEMDRAELDLRHTVVRAPDDGIVAMVDRLQVGDFLSAAAPAFALVSTHSVWVDANFKEVQLTHMRPGQRAAIHIDVYPDRELRGRVVGVGPGTGAEFSVLPAENATGNWVKVVQRLPVRIEFDHGQSLPILRSGLSATVTVDTGHRRALFPGQASAATPDP